MYVLYLSGAGCGNRTRVISLEGCHNTIILIPQSLHTTYHIVRHVQWRVLVPSEGNAPSSIDYRSIALLLS